jgi:hypothetical protein
MDQSKKTMRHFYCRDVLWETFEQMANDFDCSIDYLVNEAMRYYARSKNYQSPPGQQMTGGQPVPGGPGPGGPPNAPGASYPPPNKPMAGPRSGAPTNQPPNMGMGGGARARPAPPTPGYAAGGQGGNSAHSSMARPGGGSAGPAVGMQQHAPPPSAPPAPPQMGSAGPTLFLIYNGQRYPVTKDQFIIGRGSKTSDLPIKDGNISRKHAAVIRRNGTFYIKDLGSTNGIDYKGMRIDNKRIDEGDVFHLCDYELRFTYRAD